MFNLVKCSILTIAASLITFSTDAARCTFKDIEYLNYTAYCYADQAIPDHFPPNLTTLFLGIPSGNENDTYPECTTRSEPFSYLPAGKMPIADITDLKWIQFCNFNFNNGHAEQIGPYLKHVKSTLVTLEIVYGKLTRLDAGILRGFINLKELQIVYTGFEDIEPGAFSDISLNGPALVTGLLSLSGNRLKSFDWSLLQSMSLGLEVLNLDANALESMQISGPLVLPNLNTVDLSSNNLRTIPPAIMQSLPRNLFNLNALGNPFCPTDSLCRCCAVRSLWSNALSQGIDLAMSCGPNYRYKDVSECSIAGNSTDVHRKSMCSAGCNVVTKEMVDLAEYESCAANADPRAMACDIKRLKQNPGRFKKERRPRRAALLH